MVVILDVVWYYVSGRFSPFTQALFTLCEGKIVVKMDNYFQLN